MRTTSMALLAVLPLSACVERTVGLVEPIPDTVEVKTLPISLNRELDLLFIIDNSGSMAQEHASLETRFPELVGYLGKLAGTLPDLHIGVTSSDMGTGAIVLDDPRCRPGDGDGGRLHGDTCAALQGQSFMSDILGPNGTRIRSYTGDLGAAFTCAADLGIDGCGFEQHLAAMQAALEPGANPGFVREHAQLAVIILADEDDCSVDDERLFTPGDDPVLGPFSDFRCFEHGVVCEGDPDPRVPGPRQGCVPSPDSPYLVEVEQYADFLRGLKRDPSHVFVAGIVGDPDNVQVVTSGTRPTLAVGCSGGLGDAAPAVRLAGFLEQFPDRQRTEETICTADLGAALREIIEDLIEVPIGVCFTNEPADRNATLEGLQPECSVTEITDPVSATGRPLPACAAGGPRPCWKVVEDVECAATEHHLRIDIERVEPGVPGAYLQVQCVVSIPVPPPS
jgi:hypothetical protein